MTLLRRIAAKLPNRWQHELRRRHFRREISRGTFYTEEKEYALLDSLIDEGDWVLDIGANVGHYAMRMSQLVGASGRVIALEPVPDTFSLLAANVQLFEHSNVSLLNVAASDGVSLVSMQIPSFEDGLSNYYQAHLTVGLGGLTILTLPVDALSLPAVKLVKMDVEGHELAALRGMRELLGRHHPTLIVETASQEPLDLVERLGYSIERLSGSSNVICRPRV